MRSEPVEVRVGEERRSFHGDAVRGIERELVERTLLAGTPDAVFDAATEEAVRKFQAQQGLKATGFPDQATLFKLFYGESD